MLEKSAVLRYIEAWEVGKPYSASVPCTVEAQSTSATSVHKLLANHGGFP